MENNANDPKAKTEEKPKIPPAVLVFGGILIGAICVWFGCRSFCYVDTDDAFIEGHIVAISPKVSAHVQKVLAKDNQRVKTGDLLVELDSQDFEVRAAMAKANLEAAKAEEEQSRRDVDRYKLLVEKEEISKQQFDKAELRLQTAAAQRAAAESVLKQADLDVSYTKIFAPVDGHITRKSVEQGAFVQVGQPLLAVVSDEMWVVANFKETQLKDMRPRSKGADKG